MAATRCRHCYSPFFLLLILASPRSTLFPYTTLFRSTGRGLLPPRRPAPAPLGDRTDSDRPGRRRVAGPRPGLRRCARPRPRAEGGGAMTRPVRIANYSGFYGDRLAAAREMVEGGPVDGL